jgi:ubiquitin carboxyl-terminal hydrolase 47
MALVVYTGNAGMEAGNNFSSATCNDINGTRDENSYVGLSNQGATCYLNSLLQTLFMTPEFRKAIFTWQYERSKHGPEHLCIPLQLQRLFGQLALGKMRAVDTVALTKSFGWEGSEVFQQQDVQELTRVLFDALEETFKVLNPPHGCNACGNHFDV